MARKPIILDSDSFSREILGSTLYKAFCRNVMGPEPWYLLRDEERNDYEEIALDYVRRLADLQSFGAEKSAELWIYDVFLNDARQVHAVTDGEDTRVWRCYTKGKNIFTYVLGESIFLRKDEALAYGVEVLGEYKEHQEQRLATVMDRYAAALAELEARRGQIS